MELAGDIGFALHTIIINKERELFQKSLIESENNYRNLFETMGQGVVYQDSEGSIISANPSAEKILGLTLEQMQGKTSMDPHWRAIHEDGSEFVGETHPSMISLKTGLESKDIMGVYNQEEDKYRWINIHAVPKFRKNEDKPYQVFTTFEDVTPLKESEIMIKKSLEEKDVLLREVHHRVKNNMQIISSLLNLQFNEIDDEYYGGLLKETQLRVKSMALVHEQLYIADDLAHINFENYVTQLAKNILLTLNCSPNIKMDIQIRNIFLDINNAIPCGLIINELITNSFKHAFPENMPGIIKVKFTVNNNFYNLIVEDDGIGFPQHIDFRNTNTMGMQLVNSLVNQLDGKIEMHVSKGTRFNITLQKLVYKSRGL